MEFYLLIVMILGITSSINGEINPASFKEISKINNNGPYIGIVVPNPYELKPLLTSSSFVAHSYFDIAGRHFRIGELASKKVIVVMSGLGMINGALATELLVTLFDVKGVLHHGIAGNLNPKFSIGDVVIPQYWAYTGLWFWERFGDKKDGPFKSKFGNLEFSKYNNHTENHLNKVWYERGRIFRVNETPEVWKNAFWIPVDKTYFEIAKKLKNNIELHSCVNTNLDSRVNITCLPRKPIIKRVKKGISADVFVDNRAYREHLRSNFDATPTDMESAAVARVCYEHKLPFIVIRALSDLAGGGSALTNEASVLGVLASQNAFDVLVKFISLL